MFVLCTLCLLAAHHSFTEDIAEVVNKGICSRLEITQNLLNLPVSPIQGNFWLDSFDQYLVWETVRDISLAIIKCYGEEYCLHGHLLAAYNKRRTINMGCSCPYLRQIEEARCREESSNPIHAKFYFGNTLDIMNEFGILKINASQTQLLNDGIGDISYLMQMFSELNRDATENLHFEAGKGSNAWRMKIYCYVFYILQTAEIFEKPWTFSNFVINQYRYNHGFCQVEFDDMFEYASEENLERFSVLDDVEYAFLRIFSTGKLNSIYKCTAYMDNMKLTLKVSNSSMYSERFIVREEECLWNICESYLFILQGTCTIFHDEETILSLYMNPSVKQQLNFSNNPNYTVCLLKKNDRTLSNWCISQIYTYEIILLWRYSLGRVNTDEDIWQSNFRCALMDSKNRNNGFQDISCDTLQEKCTDSLQLDNIIKNTSFLFVLLLTFCKLCFDKVGNITVQSPTYTVNLDIGKFMILKILGNLFNYCKYRISRNVLQDKGIYLCGDRPKMKTTIEKDVHLKNDEPHVRHYFNEDNKMHQNEFFEGYGDPRKLPKTTEHEFKFKSIPWYLRLQPSYIQTFVTVLPLSLKEYINEKVKTPDEHKSQLMKYEWERYKSFQNFPCSSPAQPVRLAQAGFYYSNVADEVTCFSCGIKCHKWQFGDQPNKMHAQMSPACSFISRRSDNIPIVSEEWIQNQDNPLLCSSDAHTHIVDEVDSYCSESTWNSSPDYCTAALRDSLDTFGGDSELRSGLPFESSPGDFVLHLKSEDNEGIQKFSDEHRLLCGFGHKANTPRYPQYIVLRDRLESFTGWPICAQQEPKVLAEAGLFYTGLSDCVRCFQCGGSLRSWQQNDVPWNEHARWYPDCSFVLRCKGRGFIEKHLCRQDRLNLSDATQCSQVLCQNDYGASSSASANTIKENVLHKEPVRTVLDMGFPVHTVQTAVMSLQERQKNRSFSVTDLLEVLLLEDSTENDLGSTSSKQAPMVRSFVRNITEESEETPDRKVKETISYKEEVRGSRRKDVATVIDGKDGETSAARLSQKDYESLMEENRVLKDQMTCKICMDAEACIVFLPCSHMMTCSQCAPAFRKCPMCRQLIRGTVRAHL